MKRPVPVESASALIDERIKELGDWRGKTLAKVREIVHEADPEIVEDWKWRGTPVWSHGGSKEVAQECRRRIRNFRRLHRDIETLLREALANAPWTSRSSSPGTKSKKP